MDYWCQECNGKWPQLEDYHNHNCLGVLLSPEQVRGATHGDYTHMSIVIQKIKDAMRSGESWGQCSATQRETLESMAIKIGRIVCGNPNHRDHWDDLVGYPTLQRDRMAVAAKD